MKTKFFALCLALMSLTIITNSCSPETDKPEVVNLNSSLTLTLKNSDIKEYKQLEVEIFETNTGKTIKENITTENQTITLPKGFYKISANGSAVTTTGEEVHVGGIGTINLTGDTHNLSIELTIKIFSEDFIIEEIFSTGVNTDEGNLYASGRYFKLTNNTDKVLKTGGLLILQSAFLTITNNNVTPDVKNEAFAVKGVLMIPNENSKDVEPGDFIVIADMAINHKKPNIPAFDLSKADYEYPNLENPKLAQVDNPEVPNAEVIFSIMNFNMFFLHNRATESFAIARFPEGVTKEEWAKNYVYNYEYATKNGKVMERTAMKVPNIWIIDGVNSTILSKWEHNPLDASIDSGYTGISEIDSDPARFGKSVRRKIIGKMANGKNLYKDTNNSTEDFIRASEASLKDGIVH